MQIAASVSTLGSMEQQKRLEIIAGNIANSETPGFKRDRVHFSDFINQTSYTQMDQGRIHDTGDSLNVALMGKGFMRVQSPDGVLYTRAGDLTIDGNNTLVTQEGWPVLGQGGPVQITSSDVRIDGDGQIYVDGSVVDRLDLVEFGDDVRLEKTSYQCFKPVDEGQTPTAATDCTVRQGSIEGSNVAVVEEMTEMIDTMRVFEAYQKTLQAVSEEDSQIITKLGSS
ncbi:MAG: flagellar hook-basal body protein [Syntrophobacteraceae bacterium]